MLNNAPAILPTSTVQDPAESDEEEGDLDTMEINEMKSKFNQLLTNESALGKDIRPSSECVSVMRRT